MQVLQAITARENVCTPTIGHDMCDRSAINGEVMASAVGTLPRARRGEQ
jgi:hypothetical protein